MFLKLIFGNYQKDPFSEGSEEPFCLGPSSSIIVDLKESVKFCKETCAMKHAVYKANIDQ